jgi:Ni,Fe-hydrogenase maturation factor
MKIYIFGNPLVKEDSLPLKILPKLKSLFPQIKFETVDPNENFPPKDEKNLIILDTVIGVKKPTIFNLDDFEKGGRTPMSPHDYDLLMHLLLLKKMKKIDKVKIIGLPPGKKLSPSALKNLLIKRGRDLK